MRCKPGDLAIVGSGEFAGGSGSDHFAGHVVRVTVIDARMTAWHGCPFWDTDPPKLFGGLIVAFDDAVLTPLRGDLTGDTTDTPVERTAPQTVEG